MNLFATVRRDLMKLVDNANIAFVKAAASGQKIGVREALLKLLGPAIPEAMKIVEQFAVTGAEKKEAVLLFVGEFYDLVVRPLPLLGGRVTHVVLRKLTLLVADWAIDSFIAFARSPKPDVIVQKLMRPY